VDERGGEVEAPPHAARVGTHGAVGGVGQAEPLEQGFGPFSSRRLRKVGETADHHEVLAAGEHLVDGGVLPGQADGVAHGLRLARHVVPQHCRPPGVGLQDRGQYAHRRGLACAVGAEEAEHGGGGDVEVDAVQGDDVTEAFRQVFDGDCDGGLWHGRPVWRNRRQAPCQLRTVVSGVDERRAERARPVPRVLVAPPLAFRRVRIPVGVTPGRLHSVQRRVGSVGCGPPPARRRPAGRNASRRGDSDERTWSDIHVGGRAVRAAAPEAGPSAGGAGLGAGAAVPERRARRDAGAGGVPPVGPCSVRPRRRHAAVDVRPADARGPDRRRRHGEGHRRGPGAGRRPGCLRDGFAGGAVGAVPHGAAGAARRRGEQDARGAVGGSGVDRPRARCRARRPGVRGRRRGHPRREGLRGRGGADPRRGRFVFGR
jgi:hypothetical protein